MKKAIRKGSLFHLQKHLFSQKSKELPITENIIYNDLIVYILYIYSPVFICFQIQHL